MYSIGRFSKMTGISNKALIWYDNIGLLKPAKVNRENGYRFYDDENLKQVVDIRFWQEMGFSINEISHLSGCVIDEKIQQLEAKIDFISSNIQLLQKFKEGNMGKEKISIFNIEEELIRGKWRYRQTSTDFNDVLDSRKRNGKEEDMPKYLFFGEGNIGTDLKDIFGYSNCFSIEDGGRQVRNFWYFVVNYRSTLVLYEKPKFDDSSEKIKFHIYEKLPRESYSSKDIKFLCEKYADALDSCHKYFNQNLVGKFKIYDQILESEMKDYSGKIKTKDAGFGLEPIFSILDIKDNVDPEGLHDVFVMEDDDELQIKSSEGEKIYTRENSVMKLHMCSRPRAEFYIYNFNKQVHRGWYRKIGDDEFVFVDLDCDPNVDEEIYVFKKEK